MKHAIIFYDGACLLCQRSVRFLLMRDVRRRFRYASLEGKTAKQHLTPALRDRSEKGTLVFRREDGTCLVRSDAVLSIGMLLGGWWRCVGVFWLIPRGIRDWLYGRISRYRGSLFREQAAVSRPCKAEEKHLFLP